MKKIVCVQSLLILILFLFSLARAAIIHVPADYALIQAAIDAAGINDTVRVTGGTYHEYLTIDKTVHVIGDGSAVTSIVGADSGDVVVISANSVTFKGFSVSNSGDTASEFEGYDAGIQIDGADSCRIEFCNFHDNDACGLALADSWYNTISHCMANNNRYGIVFHSIDTIGHMWRNNMYNHISLNSICNNTSNGVYFAHGMNMHESNNLDSNIIYGNGAQGLYMIMSRSNEVTCNNFISNYRYGILKRTCGGGGAENNFNNDIFVGNHSDSVQAYCENSATWEDEYWNYNYWSDYTGIDEDENGYGDEPYYLDGWLMMGPAYDPFPLMAYPDTDADSISDCVDNCISISNFHQTDIDHDWIGDACDNCIDSDHDGYGDLGHPENECEVDNCPFIYNPDQLDSNADGVGDACNLECGDVNGSWSVNILDITYLIAFLYKDGPPPVSMQAADVNNTCDVNILDITYMINFLYKDGASPDCPDTWPCR